MEIDVKKVAELARLSLSKEEAILFQKQLSAILDYAHKLQALDTTDVPPTSHALPLKNVFREDQVIPFDCPEEILNNAPEAEDYMFKVPKILE
jgi:aspartyl-tRNA(Asn)/glutamyl-tRNA(Gln) amidotransferase subunit C